MGLRPGIRGMAPPLRQGWAMRPCGMQAGRPGQQRPFGPLTALCRGEGCPASHVPAAGRAVLWPDRGWALPNRGKARLLANEGALFSVGKQQVSQCQQQGFIGFFIEQNQQYHQDDQALPV